MGEVCVAIDFETSGYHGYSACALGMARIENLSIVDNYYTLIKPPSSRIYFSQIHGLTWKDLKDANPITQLWPQILSFIEGADYLLAHNAPFDRGVWNSCCAEFSLPNPAPPFLCTLKGSRKLLPLRRHRLSDICAYLGIHLHHHHAGSDALACALIYLELIKRGITNAGMRSGGK